MAVGRQNAEPRRRRWAVRRGYEAEQEDDEEGPSLLSLCHFSRPPFVAFGRVRVGEARARLLVLENPNAEPLSLALDRSPPASKGFAVEAPTPGFPLFLQPGERILISITWTPLEGGKIRELVTFIVNGVVKHQAILLGTAEQQVKKKIPEKRDGERSPLQSCENFEVNKGNISPNRDSLILLENNLSLSPVNPVLQENHHATYAPFSMRRSATHSDISIASCDKLLKDVKETHTVVSFRDYAVETEWKGPHNISSVEEQNSNAEPVCTPEQRLYVPLNHRRILSPDSFVSNSYELTEEPGLRTILSPDQFLKENQIVIQPLLQVHKSMPPSSDVKSCMSSPDFPKQKGKTQAVFFPGLGDRKDRKCATFQDKKIANRLRETRKDQSSCLQKERPKKKPILSSTVTKCKADPAKIKEAEAQLNPKSRRCLSSALQKSVDIVPENVKLEILPRPPVIEPHGHKRKSGEYLTDSNNGNEAYGEKTKRKRVLMACVENENQSPLQTLVCKSVNREKQRKKRTDSLSKKFRTARRTRNVPIAQSQLIFVKPLKTDTPRHPMPFVAKNMFFDERWKEKQQRGFTWWLNFILTPDDFTVKTDISQVNAASLTLGTECNHKSSLPKAPTKEEASLRAYTARCKLNKLRRSACCLFSSDEMVKAIKRLEIEIEAKRLLVRKDKHLWKDIGERQKILNWLLCYNPLWLRIGLETVYGELIALESNSDVMGLAMFILNRLLWNPDIAAEYRHSTVPHLYRDGHEEALSRFTLKKILLLVCFLDHAKRSRIIDHDPCLFCKNAEFKASKEILLAFSRDFLSGEGDLSRHLGFLNLPVSHVQTPLDEFDFAVTNLATDLQCGIRLVRALELLSSDWSLSKKLRIPAISRLQKLYNVNLVLQALKDRGINLNDEYGVTIDAKDIVGRHREKTFALLWKIVFAFQVNISLDKDQVKEEIHFLKNLYISKIKTVPGEFSICSDMRKESNFYSSENCSENVKLLMDWVNAVCCFYNVKVENFTVSFSDGRVLCYLIHHYHPCHVPLESICQRTTQTVECTKNGTIALNSSSESDASLNLLNENFDQTLSTSVTYKELLDNEKRNFQLISAAVSHLGGVPEMIHHSDMSNTIPDEKVVIIYLSFLCSRLLELSKEIRAARLIQSTWRKYRRKIKLAQIKQQTLNATVVLQKYWRRCLAQMELQKLKKSKQEETEKAVREVIQKQHEAAIVLQAWYRMKKQRKLFLMMSSASVVIQRCYRAYRKKTPLRWKFVEATKAAVCLQAVYRGYRLRKMLRHQNMAAVKIQAAFRAYTARIKYQALIHASCVIQKGYRASKTRRQFLKTKAAVTLLQAVVRGWQVRKWLKEQHAAAVIMQSTFRRHRALKRYRILRNAVITLQQHYRAKMSSKKQQQEYVLLRNKVIQLQAAWRGSLVRRQIQKQHQAAGIIQCFYTTHVAHRNFKCLREAAITIQRRHRGVVQAHRQRDEYLTLKEATIKIQAIYRGVRARQKLKRLHQAAVCIQAMFRMHQCHVKYSAMKLSATVIQRRYRAFCTGKKEREKYLELRKSCIILQAAYRSMKVRQELKNLHHAATSLQSFYRMYRQRKSFQKLIAAAKLIQQWYRGCKDRNAEVQKYMQVKMSILRIQSGFRGMKVRLQLKRMHMAAIVIQRKFRTFLQRQHYLSLKTAIVTIQRRFRAMLLSKQQYKEYLCLRKAVIIIQSAFRGQQARNLVKQMHAAATIIQAAFRMHLSYTRYQNLRLVCITIQQHYRAYRKAKHSRELYLKQQQSVLVLQAVYRGMKSRLLLKKQHNAATIIQSNYRKYTQQCYYRKLQWAARVIQRRVRANKLSKIAIQQYLCVKRAIICIQKAFRRMKARQHQKRQQQAALVLQRSFKMQRERRKYLTLRATTILLQRQYRTLILARRQTQEYNSVRAAVCIQSFYRGFRVRKEAQLMHFAARVIQASFRMHRTRLLYQRLRKAAVTIQNYYRSYLKRKHQQKAYLAIRRSAIVLQAAYRGLRTRQELKAMHDSAIVIQSFYRMHIQRKHYKSICWAVITIQSAYRGAVGRKKAKRTRAAMIQSFYMATQKDQLSTEALILRRMHTVHYREQYQKHWEATLLIQQYYQSYLTMKYERAAYLQTLKNIIVLQAAIRGFLERQRLHRMKRSIIKIQALFRGYKARRLVKEMTTQNPDVVAQLCFHRHRTTKECEAVERATIVIQGYHRTKQQRIWFLRMKAAAIVIQRKWRATIAARKSQQRFLAVKTAVVLIQAAYRGHSTRKQYKRSQCRLHNFTTAASHHLAAIRIQRAYRIHLQSKRAQMQLSSVLYIQRWYRTKMQRRKYLKYREKIIKIQRMVRRWMNYKNKSTCAINKDTRQATLDNGITKFQALWRGYSWRKKTDTAETRALRDSLVIANKESKEEKKLCNRTTLAVHHLLKYKHFSQILAALNDLEVVTRLSPVCCESMAQTEAVSTIFTLIQSCNRSVPCMDVIRYSVQVLLNLSKYNKTIDTVYAVERCVETLLDLLQMYRERAGDRISEKCGSIFTKTCCLFALLLEDPKRASEIRSNPRVLARLQSLYRLIARKHQMDAQRNLARQKAAAYNGHCSEPVIPSRKKVVLRPAWILRKDNFQEIVDPLQAIKMVMDNLGISYN
ncbi:abnormal spindle-like microcephaly-associated protein isoform X2 [Anolis carolinensis]|uniref:abnormal spindle-like microcephaly-associated protein isoform X2 n=1 Tax=Anolis carolinensis TaxID=28377 RepID=UPI002F2B73AD